MAFLVVFGGIVGSVSATAAFSSTPSGSAQSTEQVSFTATAQSGNDLTFAIDADQSTSIESGEYIDTVVPTNGEATVTFSAADFGVSADGDYTVYVIEETTADASDDTTYSVADPSTFYDESATFTVDDSAPTLDSASKVDNTHIDVTISDNVNINESSIAASDFALSTGSVSDASASDSGTTTTVTLTLANPVDADSVNVSIASGQSIADTAGNTLDDTAIAVTANNMDGVAPAVTSVTVTRDGGDDTVATGDTVNVTASVADGGSGVGSVTLNASALGGSSALTLNDADSDGTYNATFQVSSPTADDGAVSLTVNATDNNGNFNDTESDSVTLDTTGPAASNFDPADGETVTTKQPTLGVDLTDATSVNASAVSVTVNNTDGSKTYLDGVGTSETGVSYSSNRLSVDLSSAGVTLDEKQVTVEVTVNDGLDNAATHVWNFTVDAADKKSGSDDDWGRDDDTTEEPSETTTESDDSAADDNDDGSDESTPSTTEAADDVTTAGPTAESTGTSAATEVSDATDADGETTATGVPGFGALVTVVALLAAALLARRES
ncbi:fibronectin type III domain-containing protein [Halogeometricum pallidum JCM 14848]|uniref:Fibronectin type III domain-containing protein n=2 Tax=Halogeometricum TaxID=60846 RepID=M0CUM5_HALPD|nr:fibronectin type III domain-containing protein [Halogeometricum pallidum JCM 14848]